MMLKLANQWQKNIQSNNVSILGNFLKEKVLDDVALTLVMDRQSDLRNDTALFKTFYGELELLKKVK